MVGEELSKQLSLVTTFVDTRTLCAARTQLYERSLTMRFTIEERRICSAI